VTSQAALTRHLSNKREKNLADGIVTFCHVHPDVFSGKCFHLPGPTRVGKTTILVL
jgi:flagellar biosynthesis GTPase FlhF